MIYCVCFAILQNSSVEGVFAPQRSTHPFRIIENDAISIQSMTSLGRVGRILAGTVDVTNSAVDKDTYSTNASMLDWNTANTSNASSNIADSVVERKTKPAINNSSNANDSSPSSNDNTSNNTMTLQGLFNFQISFQLIYFCGYLNYRTNDRNRNV